MIAERIDLRALVARPWKNGAGVTREIARGGPGGDAFDWRISVAEVERDAPFSQFPGVDRCIVLLRGAGMRLRARDGSVDHRLIEPYVPLRFAADVALDATLVGGASSDFNVMTRRGAFRSDVRCCFGATHIAGGDVTLLVSCEGEWRIDDDHVIGALHALLWREPLGSVDVRPAAGTGPATLLCVRLCHDRCP